MAGRRQTRSLAQLDPDTMLDPSLTQLPVTQRQRKRGRTGSASDAKPPAKRPTGKRAPKVTTNPDDSSLVRYSQATGLQGASPDVSTSGIQQHSYGTRRTNDPHPAKSAGMARRTQAEVQATAAAKRAEKKSKSDARQDAQEHEAHLEALGSATLSKLFNTRMLTEEEHNNNLVYRGG